MFNPESLGKCRTLKLRLHVDANPIDRGWQGTVTVSANSRKPVTINCPEIHSSRDEALLDAYQLERQTRKAIYAVR